MGHPKLRAIRSSVQTAFPGRCLTSFVDLQGLDRAMVLASQSFTALIPLLILMSAFLPTSRGTAVSDSIIRRFGLSGDAAASVEIVFAHPGSSSIGAAGLVLLVFSGVSLTRRLQRMYLQAWQLERLPGMRGSLNAALGLAVLLVEIALIYFARSIVRTLPLHWVVGVPFGVAASLALWTSVPWLLLDRRISWRRLLPAGALTGTAVSLSGIATSVYMPRLMGAYSERYGLFGVTVAIVGWLLCISFIIVAATVIAAELDRAPEPWARRLRARLGDAGGGEGRNGAAQ